MRTTTIAGWDWYKTAGVDACGNSRGGAAISQQAGAVLEDVMTHAVVPAGQKVHCQIYSPTIVTALPSMSGTACANRMSPEYDRPVVTFPTHKLAPCPRPQP